MTKLVLIRHTQSKYNVENKLTGSGSNPELTKKGFNQADLAGRDLYSKYNSEFDFMVTSGLVRAHQTATVINLFLNIDDISNNENLQERNYGIYEGQNFEECWPIISSLPDNELIPAGESKEMFLQRTTEALCVYLQGEKALGLVVTHGHVIREAVKYFLGRDEYVPNGAFVELDRESIVDFGGKCDAISNEG